MRYLLYIFLFFLFPTLTAQEITLQKGVVMDSLVINDSINESFSLYLPRSFDTTKPWPIVFVFDPEGRGKTVSHLFIQAAEDQGYIVASSNNIDADTTLIENVKVGARLVNKILNILPIAKNGIFTAGFSQGAQVANVLPTVFKDVQGVMVIGDSWMNSDYINKGADFSFIGLVGYSDYRFYNLLETANILDKAGLETQIYKFDGGHEWPMSNTLYNALGTFTLQALSKGHRPPDPQLVEVLYEADIETAEKMRRMMQPYKAFEYLEQLEDKYALYGKKDDLKQRKKEVRRARLFRAQRRQYNNVSITEAELRETYIYFFNEDVYTSNFENLGWWNEQIAELKKLQQEDNRAEAEMAFRLEGLLQAFAHNSFADLKEKNASIDPLIFTAILQTIFDKENPEGYKNIISLSAQDGDYYTALLYLEDLLKTGYKDMESLYDIPGTLDLKLSSEYNNLIKKYLGESKFHNI